MLQRSSFCVGDSGSVVEAALALGVPCELQLATIDTILVALQSDEFELDDETLCKLVAVLTTALPLPQFEYLIEAQVHSSIMLAEDIESLHLPAKYRIAPQAAGHIFRANLQAQLSVKSLAGVFVTIDADLEGLSVIGYTLRNNYRACKCKSGAVKA